MDVHEIWEMFMKYDREMIAPRFAAMDKRFDSLVTRDEFLSHMDRMYICLRLDQPLGTIQVSAGV